MCLHSRGSDTRVHNSNEKIGLGSSHARRDFMGDLLCTRIQFHSLWLAWNLACIGCRSTRNNICLPDRRESAHSRRRRIQVQIAHPVSPRSPLVGLIPDGNWAP